MPDIFDNLTEKNRDIFDSVASNKKASLPIRLGAKLPAEFFGSTIGQIPAIAEIAETTTPFIEQLEEFERPSFLSSTGLEAAPEKGLRNLLSLLGKSETVKKLTPEALEQSFAESTQEKFEPQTKLERALLRGTKLAAGIRGLGGGLRSTLGGALGGLLGQTGREYGLPESLASTVEFLTPAAAETLTPQLIPKAYEKKITDFAKAKGLTEKEIIPLLKSKETKERLGGLALKTKDLKKTVKSLGNKFEENFYEPLKESANNLPRLNEKQTVDFLNSLEPAFTELKASKLPTPDKQYALEQLIKLGENVEREGLTPRSIIDTWQDLNKNVNWKKAGSKPSKIIKNVLMDTFEKVNPELAEEFALTNDLYSRYIPFKNALKPNVIDNILKLGTEGEIALALAFHNPSLLKKALGAIGGKYVAKQLLTSPRYHNLSEKMKSAVAKQDKTTISKLIADLNEFLEKDGKLSSGAKSDDR